MIDKQTSVAGAVSTLASGDYKWLLTSGQFKWACIKSKNGAVALVVVFD